MRKNVRSLMLINTLIVVVGFGSNSNGSSNVGILLRRESGS